MRGWILLPIALVAAVLVALPAIALTESGLEKDVKEAAGFDLDECEPATNLASPWVEGSSLAFKRDEPRAVVIDEKVYLVGGSTAVEPVDDGGHPLVVASNRLTRFDPRTERYEELAPIPKALNHIGLAVYQGDLYVVSGYGRRLDADTSKKFYRYDPESDRWSRLPDMPEARAAAAVGVIGDRLLVAGGALNSVAHADTFAFDFQTGRWSRLPDMPSRREHVGAAVADGKLYVLGGRTSESLAVPTAERYDPRTQRWERLQPLPVPTGGLEAITWNGKPIAIGGGDDGGESVTGAVQEYDPKTDSWTRLPDLRTARHGHGAALVGDTVWVFGGSDCAYFNATDKVESLNLSSP